MNKRKIRLLIPLAVLLFVLVMGIRQGFRGDWGALVIFACEIVLGFVIIVALYPFRLRQVLIKVFSSPSQRPAKLEEFPLLDTTKLEQLTQEWQALGFVHHADLAGGEANPKTETTFLRISLITSGSLLLSRSGTHSRGISPSFSYGMALGIFVAVALVLTLRALGLGPCSSNCLRRWKRK